MSSTTIAKNDQRKFAKQLDGTFSTIATEQFVLIRLFLAVVSWILSAKLQQEHVSPSLSGFRRIPAVCGGSCAFQKYQRENAFTDCATISQISKDSLSSETTASIRIWENIPLAAHSPDWRTARTSFIRHVLIDRTLVVHQTDGLQDGRSPEGS